MNKIGKGYFQKGHKFLGDLTKPNYFQKGQHPSPKTEFKKGSMLSEKVRRMNKERWIGNKNPRWNNGITPLRKQIRECFKYRQWVSDIFQKDNYICQECFVRGGKLHIHHIKSFSDILKEYKIKTFEEAMNCEELWNINNGKTLCINCHKKTDNYLNK